MLVSESAARVNSPPSKSNVETDPIPVSTILVPSANKICVPLLVAAKVNPDAEAALNKTV